jgi:hypothetical protein
MKATVRTLPRTVLESKKDASQLDTWVFEHIEKVFDDAKTNRTLNDQLHSDKIVFFLQYRDTDQAYLGWIQMGTLIARFRPNIWKISG